MCGRTGRNGAINLQLASRKSKTLEIYPQFARGVWPGEDKARFGKLVFQVTGACAEFERSTIRQRIKAGLKCAIAQGARFGRPKVDIALERKAQKHLKKGVGILKAARMHHCAAGGKGGLSETPSGGH